MRMDQSVATESNRSMYPPPGLDDPNHVTVHPSASTTVTTGHPNMTRRPVPGRRRTPSQTSTAAPLPQEDGSSRYLDLDTLSACTDETGFLENKRPRTSEFPATPSSERGMLGPLDSSETVPSIQLKSRIAQSSLSIATECWTLEKRLARGFIPNPSLSENALLHRKRIMQNSWWERGTI